MFWFGGVWVSMARLGRDFMEEIENAAAVACSWSSMRRERVDDCAVGGNCMFALAVQSHGEGPIDRNLVMSARGLSW